ncbi:MAG: MOSC domain-containing protein [Gammaproteobacteria bacterium]
MHPYANGRRQSDENEGSGTTVRFTVGAVRFEGTNPCQRCVVPTRDPLTGTEDRGFQKTLAARRAETLPAWAPRSRFNHFYRLAVNMRIPPSEAGKPILVGDPVEITDPGKKG